MVEIEHLSPPPSALASLAAASPVPAWSELKGLDKNAVRHHLNREQHGICAYCERGLHPDHGRIDHIIAQGGNENLRFAYSNLCHSCSGYYTRDGCEQPGQHSCDQVKGSESLLGIEPRPGVNSKIAFNTATGQLRSSLPQNDPVYLDVEKVVNRILGLNNIFLKDARKRHWQKLKELIDDGLDPLALIRPCDEYYWTMREFFRPL